MVLEPDVLVEKLVHMLAWKSALIWDLVSYLVLISFVDLSPVSMSIRQTVVFELFPDLLDLFRNQYYHLVSFQYDFA